MVGGVPASVKGVTEAGGVGGGVGIETGGGVDVVPVVDVLPDVAVALWDVALEGTPPEQAAKSAAIANNPENLNIYHLDSMEYARNAMRPG